MTMTTDRPTILDCGHEATPPTTFHANGVPLTTGVAHTPDGRSICYSCADDEQREALLGAGTVPFVAYLSSDRKCVTTWTGGTLGTVTRYTTGQGRWSTYGIVHRCYVRVTDVHGQEWTGTGPVENGDYVRLRKLANRT